MTFTSAARSKETVEEVELKRLPNKQRIAAMSEMQSIARVPA
jgi:hypothetical protein